MVSHDYDFVDVGSATAASDTNVNATVPRFLEAPNAFQRLVDLTSMHPALPTPQTIESQSGRIYKFNP